jgi:hypothetical protein
VHGTSPEEHTGKLNVECLLLLYYAVINEDLIELHQHSTFDVGI